SSMIESLAPGNYSLSLSDVNGCTFFSVYQIGEPTGLDLTFSTAEPQPPLGNNGSIIAKVTGGVTPYSYLWSTGETSSQINDLAPGTYRVTVTDGNGCEMLGSVDLELMTTSTAQPASLTHWMVYPNPTAASLVLDAAFNRSEEIDIELLNLVGQQMLHRRFQSSSINTIFDLSLFPAGAYLLRLRTKDGEMVTKVIKM
ncbi:MAG: T9SS type A sorting domain-containing protein, partial [Bacteroidota bacterium]